MEYLGNAELVHAQVEGIEIVAMLSSNRPVHAGEQVDLALPIDKLHLFDPDTEVSLSAA